MKLWQYVIWWLVKAVFLILTSPVWFPLGLIGLAICYGIIIPIAEWYDDVCHEYSVKVKPSHSVKEAQEIAGWDIWKGLTMFNDPSRNDY